VQWFVFLPFSSYLCYPSPFLFSCLLRPQIHVEFFRLVFILDVIFTYDSVFQILYQILCLIHIHQIDISSERILWCYFSCSIYPSQPEPGAVQIPIGNNTGSLPDLTSFHFPPPLPTPLDQEDPNSSPYSTVSVSLCSYYVGHHPLLCVYLKRIQKLDPLLSWGGGRGILSWTHYKELALTTRQQKKHQATYILLSSYRSRKG
jgi:hypothetical protein